eukprot:1395733-Pyramimonas_sp.AAC.1
MNWVVVCFVGAPTSGRFVEIGVGEAEVAWYVGYKSKVFEIGNHVLHPLANLRRHIIIFCARGLQRRAEDVRL